MYEFFHTECSIICILTNRAGAMMIQYPYYQSFTQNRSDLKKIKQMCEMVCFSTVWCYAIKAGISPLAKSFQLIMVKELKTWWALAQWYHHVMWLTMWIMCYHFNFTEYRFVKTSEKPPHASASTFLREIFEVFFFPENSRFHYSFFFFSSQFQNCMLRRLMETWPVSNNACS